MFPRPFDPFGALARIEEELVPVRRHIAGLRRGDLFNFSAFRPSVQVTTEGEDLVLAFDLPGVDVEKDVSITLEGGTLVVSGERHSEVEEGSLTEVSYGSFRRTMSVPDTLKPEDVEASYFRGVLSVRVKGAITAAPEPTKIEIRTADEPKAVASSEPSPE